MIKCPACESAVSSNDMNCPRCGISLHHEAGGMSGGGSGTTTAIVVVIIVVMLGVGLLLLGFIGFTVFRFL